MKKLIILLMAAALVSCKKESTCYTCELVRMNGERLPSVRWCGDGNHVFTDVDGSPLQSFCRP